jgi:hypothetical protein
MPSLFLSMRQQWSTHVRLLVAHLTLGPGLRRPALHQRDQAIENGVSPEEPSAARTSDGHVEWCSPEEQAVPKPIGTAQADGHCREFEDRNRIPPNLKSACSWYAHPSKLLCLTKRTSGVTVRSSSILRMARERERRERCDAGGASGGTKRAEPRGRSPGLCILQINWFEKAKRSSPSGKRPRRD